MTSMGDPLRAADFTKEVEAIDPFEEEWDDATVYPQHEEMMRLLTDTEGVDNETATSDTEDVTEEAIELGGELNA